MRRISLPVILLWLLGAFCVFGAYMAWKTGTEYRSACEAAGGVPFQAKHARICLNPNAVI